MPEVYDKEKRQQSKSLTLKTAFEAKYAFSSKLARARIKI